MGRFRGRVCASGLKCWGDAGLRVPDLPRGDRAAPRCRGALISPVMLVKLLTLCQMNVDRVVAHSLAVLEQNLVFGVAIRPDAIDDLAVVELGGAIVFHEQHAQLQAPNVVLEEEMRKLAWAQPSGSLLQPCNEFWPLPPHGVAAGARSAVIGLAQRHGADGRAATPG